MPTTAKEGTYQGHYEKFKSLPSQFDHQPIRVKLIQRHSGKSRHDLHSTRLNKSCQVSQTPDLGLLTT